MIFVLYFLLFLFHIKLNTIVVSNWFTTLNAQRWKETKNYPFLILVHIFYNHKNTFSSSRRNINFSHLLKIVSNSYFKHKVKKPTRKEKFNLYFCSKIMYFAFIMSYNYKHYYSNDNDDSQYIKNKGIFIIESVPCVA